MKEKKKKRDSYPFTYKDEALKGFIRRLKELDYLDLDVGRLTADFLDAVDQIGNEGED